MKVVQATYVTCIFDTLPWLIKSVTDDSKPKSQNNLWPRYESIPSWHALLCAP